jgi:hypothetical protein
VRRRGQRGQSIIELVLILPVMLVMFLGVWSGAELIGNNEAASQVTGYGARLGASLGNDGYVAGQSTESGCQHAANDPCIVDNAMIAAIVPAMENELPSAQLFQIDIYQPDTATTTCLPNSSGVLPSSCSKVTNGALYSGDPDDEYRACLGSWTAVSSWELVNSGGGQNKSCPGSTSAVAQYTLDQRIQNHPDEQAIGIQVTFQFSSPGLKLFTQTDTQYTAISLPPEAD